VPEAPFEAIAGMDRYVSSSSAKRTTKWFVVVRLDLGEVIERCSGSEP
jgi:hypothetical protein